MRITTDGVFSREESNKNYWRQFGGIPTQETGTDHVATIDIEFQRCLVNEPIGIVKVNDEGLFTFSTARDDC